MKKAVCLISGGLDSTVATSVAASKGYQLYFLFLEYGQKTLVKERKCVEKLKKYFDPKKLTIVELPWLRQFGGSALLDQTTKLDENNPELEYVPFRNSIFLSVATAYAEVNRVNYIYIGSTGGDRICPDNSQEYLNAFQKIIDLGTMLHRNIKIKAPLIKTDKTGAIKIGRKLKTPFELTWSCHNNTEKACGVCSNCRARIEAFESNHLTDPIDYE
jgi:7-cyano-7-deazaguanine synthase